ncbi:MAG TPA: hypothetical protein PKA00_00185 [Saprospiraceae bacterium]|nr:hypothetical protein [Saprospiraceae bacterium]HMQ81281.1 hypothetical protein [Saprospiraceae bacterium]
MAIYQLRLEQGAAFLQLNYNLTWFWIRIFKIPLTLLLLKSKSSMESINTSGIAQWIADRVLAFLNQARSPESITGDGVANPENPQDPDNWEDYSIGTVVAQRIIEKRLTLPRQHFQSLDELKGIPGLGQNKFDDMIRAFSTPSAEAFRTAMYEQNIISEENWKLTYYTSFIEDAETYRNITRNETNFKHHVVEQLEKICLEILGGNDSAANRSASRLLGENARLRFIDTYSNSAGAASYAFALWWYRFDADNWFSFDRVYRVIDTYFSHHNGPNWAMDLHFFKGFKHEILSDGIVPADLPVVTSEAEQSITIWTSALYD